MEEAFFRAGAEMDERAAESESIADLDEGARRRPLLRRLFSRKAK
jgi:hypothetical protein